jgi:hypothetical protein
MPTRDLTLDGTLAVNNAAEFSTMNADGSTTTSIPVRGQLGAAGAVRGVWNQTVDATGAITGVDVLRLHNAKGSLIVVFDNQAQEQAQRVSRGVFSSPHTQMLYDDTGTFTGDSERGTIDVVTRANKQVADLVLDSNS